MRWLACLVLLLSPAAAEEGACSGRPEARDRVVSVSEDGEIVLAERGASRLAGLRLADAGPAREEARAKLAALAGREVWVAAAGARDRWDRLPVRLVAEGGGEMAEILVEAGLALVAPGSEGGPCPPGLLALEETARERALGLWAEDRYKPVPAEASGRLGERIGLFTLVEGRVRSVGERRQRTYLNFGADWTNDFTLILPKGTWTALQARGHSARSLRGRLVRVRGIVEAWQGTSMTVTLPELVEVVREKAGRKGL